LNEPFNRLAQEGSEGKKDRQGRGALVGASTITFRVLYSGFRVGGKQLDRSAGERRGGGGNGERGGGGKKTGRDFLIGPQNSLRNRQPNGRSEANCYYRSFHQPNTQKKKLKRKKGGGREGNSTPSTKETH